MLRINWKNEWKGALVLVLQFVLFAFVVSLYTRRAVVWNSLPSIVLFILLLLLLFVCVAGTFFVVMQQRNGVIDTLRSALAKEKQEQANLRESFTRNIENKTFELQKIVGALNREIGERTQAEEELRELQKQQELILDSAGEGIMGLDSTGKVIFMNNAAEVMLGWEKADLMNHIHHPFIHHSYQDGTPYPMEACPICLAYRDGQIHYKTGDVFWCKNGTSFPVEYVSTPIRDRGMLTGAVVVFRDMNTFS